MSTYCNALNMIRKHAARSQQLTRGERIKAEGPITDIQESRILSETMAKSEIDGGTCDPSHGEDDQIIVDIDSLTSSVESMMSQDLIMSDKCCIFKVPPILRRHSERAYIPNAFSIGPWHRNHQLMQSTEKIKLKYLKHLLSRESESITLKELFESTREIKKEARSCYAGPIDVGAEDFVRLLVIDGCFLIELFRKESDASLRENDDPIFNMSCMLQYLHHDLILVENQIPWLVLEHLFNKTSAKQSTQAEETTLAHLALKFFANIFSLNAPTTDTPNDGTKHLLDLLRNWLVKSSGKDDDADTGWEPIPSATDLVDAGIKLKVSDGEHGSILDIEFKNGSLEIPSLLIQETSEVILRNLISYEQCSPQCKDIITSYAMLLDNLINTTKDMDLLIGSEIITNWLNPEEATQFFNKLYHDAYLKKYYYHKLHREVNMYYRRRCPKWRAMLKRNYCSNPWTIVSMIAAATLLILTIQQTVMIPHCCFSYQNVEGASSQQIKSDNKRKALSQKMSGGPIKVKQEKCVLSETKAKFESDGGTRDPSYGEDDQVIVDIDSLTSSIESMMPQNLMMSDKWCIFRVPRILRRHRASAYIPNAFSIGPWHHYQTRSTEIIKLNYLKNLLSRESKSGITLRELVESTRKIEKEARSCYAEPINVGVEDFVDDSQERSLLDIKFNNGSLEIPSLLIQETTEVVIRNLISYEQCSPKCTDRITSYAVLLDNLINTTKDMDLLTGSGIITNWLNPEEAMQFFNKLYHDACLKKYYYQKLCHDGASSQQLNRGDRMKAEGPIKDIQENCIMSETMANFESDGGTRDPSDGEDDPVMVDIDSLTYSIKSMMSQNLIMSDKCCIFRVPHILRRHRESAYMPNAFSIGPWHSDHPPTKSTEKIKLKYLKNLLSRESKSGVTLKELVKSTREIEKEARSCYAEPIDVAVEDFVRILVIDGCFLIELFRKYNDDSLREKDDPIFNISCMMQYLYHDLILVENQIPWLVLEHLFNKTSAKQSTQAKETTLTRLALKFLGTIFSFNQPNTNILYDGKKHLLDLLRNWLVKSSGKDDDVDTGWEPIPTATDLVEAGIKLKVSDRKQRILDITFNSGSLEIPSLLIHETTEDTIRNLISYEQCSPKCTARITSYAVLLDNLINTTKDMDILTSSGIITNWLNPEEAMQFFNKLYHDSYWKEYYYVELHQKVNKYYQRRWPRWRALLMRNYFGTPWAIVSIFAAATLLILTVVQTIFTIMN
ncbi:hypothetical protein SADUNF_Sadunf16G0210400 [Salix dunnii]|uniref:Uncharacterized protein n=1 Tax=Salix dunnii TaxID=1413687 RepID=A0A835J9Z0_9ROSI|nr:hypothetical protein SADUNF_Sadunf16G0210400 [Salix dunnii]